LATPIHPFTDFVVEQLSLKYHPDRNINLSESQKTEVHEQYVRIQAAYDLLSDPTSRREYDRGFGSEGRTWTGSPAAQYKPTPGSSDYYTSGDPGMLLKCTS
jgi:curved DNA-binding protein CbpA